MLAFPQPRGCEGTKITTLTPGVLASIDGKDRSTNLVTKLDAKCATAKASVYGTKSKSLESLIYFHVSGSIALLQESY
jgi:hypothetical protein